MEAEDKPDDEESITVYLGAELYAQRMFPYNCPSFQKASIKLFRVTRNATTNAETFELIDSQYFTNRDGFGYMLRNLTKGNYQM